ncbi:MAG: hypothetical protein QXF09_01360 [Nitrososphaerota archaeon]
MNFFETIEDRFKLLKLLKSEGMYVRWHAYEYLIGYKNNLVCLIFLEPINKKVLIKKFKWSKFSNEAIEIIKSKIASINKKIEIEVID